MTADEKKLKETIANLHGQLEGLDHLDADARATLETALDDILEALAKPESTDHTPHSLAERLSEATQHFQESHPAMASTIGGIIDSLGRMGI